MYTCIDCGGIFAEPRTVYDIHSEVDIAQREYYGVCPLCGHDEMEEVNECVTEGCGNYVVDGDYCDYCKQMVIETLDNLQIRYGIGREAVVEIAAETA